jgi:glycosyltransferase involved in cell wall biosynthesis
LTKISVITVCKNPEIKDLEKTILSVQSQKSQNFEHIIIDGKSTNGTLQFLERNYHKSLKFFSSKDSGIYQAMNKGITKSNGEFIIFLNAGDHLTTDYSLISIEKFTAESNASVFYCSALWVDIYHPSIFATNHEYIHTEFELLSANFPHPSTVYRKNIFNEIGVFNEDYKVYADYEWNLRALITHKVSFKTFNTVLSTFYNDGVSNDPKSIESRSNELMTIRMKYSDSGFFKNSKKKYLNKL